MNSFFFSFSFLSNPCLFLASAARASTAGGGPRVFFVLMINPQHTHTHSTAKMDEWAVKMKKKKTPPSSRSTTARLEDRAALHVADVITGARMGYE
jgi:hypothetical protein